MIYLRKLCGHRDPGSSFNTIKIVGKTLLCLWPRDEISAYLPVLGAVVWSSQRAWQWTTGTFLSVVPASATNNSPASVSVVLKAKFLPPLLYTLFLE